MDSSDLLPQNINKFLDSIWATGPFYYYIIDFSIQRITHIGAGFREAHGIDPEDMHTGRDMVNLIYPEDKPLIFKAGRLAYVFMKNHVGLDKIQSYKFSYNFRLKTVNGQYQLFNHQSQVLGLIKDNHLGPTLGIHTNIQHLTNENNMTYSLIGMRGHPSYFNLNIFESGLPGVVSDMNP